MKKIGLLSDTHGFINERVYRFFENVDEIWHAGDIGNVETADKLAKYKPFKAVYGNIDDRTLRLMFPLVQNFECENVKVLMTHIGGYPQRYEKSIKPLIIEFTPNIFICGHSHILKVIYDKKYNLLHINPGAAGNKGFHNKCTAVRFVIDRKDIKDMEILEFDRSEVISI